MKFSRMVTLTTRILQLVVCASSVFDVSAFSPLSGRLLGGVVFSVDRMAKNSVTRSSKGGSSGQEEEAEMTKSSEPQWGASYIGGDPCGSKYNNDPHSMEITKPGMPEDMKARIQRKAEEMLRQQQEARREEEDT